MIDLRGCETSWKTLSSKQASTMKSSVEGRYCPPPPAPIEMSFPPIVRSTLRRPLPKEDYACTIQTAEYCRGHHTADGNIVKMVSNHRLRS